jgi:hypothetical protein
MAVLPARVFVDSDLDCKAKLALLNLPTSVLAGLYATTGACIGRNLCCMVSLMQIETLTEVINHAPTR